MAKIKTLEELETYSAETDAMLKTLQKTIDAMTEARDAADKQIEEIKTVNEELKLANEQLVDKVKTIQTLVKSQDAILQSDDTQEVQDYKLGKMAQVLYRGHKGSGQPGDGAEMLKLGATPTEKSSDLDMGDINIIDGYRDRRAEQVKAYGTKAAISTDPLTSDDSDSGNYYGSYLVPVDTDATLSRIAADASAMMGLVTTRPVRGITTYLPTTTDALAFTAVTTQETAKTQETLTFAKTTLTVVTYALWIAITEEVDEDSLIALGALIRTLCTEAWAAKFDSMCLEDATYGAMATTGVNAVTMGAGDTGFSNVSCTYLDSMIAALTTRSKRRGARFFFHPTVWDEIVSLKDADGRYIVRDRLSDTAPLMVRGFPVTLTDGLPGLADTAISTKFAAFGNPSYIVNGVKTGFEFRIFDQMESSMVYDLIGLRARLRQAFALWAPSAWSYLATAAV